MATADTKERILAAAESLFARQGFSATSLRNVIAEAGVNLAAVHYHFGSREKLVQAVFGWRFDPINQERLVLLSALEDGRDRVTVEKILDCLLLPILRATREQPEGWTMVGALVGRVHTEPDLEVRRIFYDQFEEVGDRFLRALGRLLPDLPGEELYYRFHFSIAAMAASLVNPEEVRFLSKGRLDPTADPERFVRRWSTFVAAGLRAAPTVEAVLSATMPTARKSPAAPATSLASSGRPSKAPAKKLSRKPARNPTAKRSTRDRSSTTAADRRGPKEPKR